MAVTCVIDFDNNPYGTYFAGQVLSGRVTLSLDKVKYVKAISLTISGYAETRWSESSTTNGKESSETYHGREDYLASLTYLMGSDANPSQISIEPGIRTYNFSCPIPAICPSSFEGSFGRVRYAVKVALVRPWKFDNTFSRYFTVLKVMDLNYDSPLLRMPAHTEIQKTYCCWPCRSEPLVLQLALPQTGFVAGQNIPVGVLVTNDSAIKVEELKVRLAMLVCYYSQGPYIRTKNERIVVSKLKGDEVLRHCKKQFTYELHVPATPPTCFNLCRIIQIAYQVELEAKVKGLHMNQTLAIPVTIGSVPLSEQVIHQPRGMMPQPLDVNTLEGGGAPANEIGFREVSQPWAVDPNIPPPNYEAALHMRDAQAAASTEPDNRERPNTLPLDGKGFTPLYPVFNIPSPTAPVDWEQNNMPLGGVANPNSEGDKGTWL
ncbi:arrestin domain-containing protein 17 [Scaptodrosophila lebanonensis]|uniref:Arrestin domain-containing protein 17 n=1 Tax=Drosophila lebanonensis TaxID=7225 RepID=A0A6J2THG4_DROLE|nr:arrestin domain-containing protein 17 [Scaptodrosophila lebanonensis]